jgi:hypothetical protein
MSNDFWVSGDRGLTERIPRFISLTILQEGRINNQSNEEGEVTDNIGAHCAIKVPTKPQNKG